MFLLSNVVFLGSMLIFQGVIQAAEQSCWPSSIINVCTNTLQSTQCFLFTTCPIAPDFFGLGSLSLKQFVVVKLFAESMSDLCQSETCAWKTRAGWLFSIDITDLWHFESWSDTETNQQTLWNHPFTQKRSKLLASKNLKLSSTYPKRFGDANCNHSSDVVIVLPISRAGF